jgi:hypothetical protein
LYGNLGTATIPNNSGFGDVLNRFVSLYTNANYIYKEKYSISASARKDESNLFGVNTNQKGTPLWSAGTAWKLSRESFYHSHFLPSLNFRLTYGYNGNVKNDLAAVPTIIYAGPDGTTNLSTALTNTLSNPELRWEKVGIINAGVDFAIKNFLEGSVDFYHKNSKDLLTLSPIDPTLGLSLMTFNTANLSGKGIDVKLLLRVGAGAVKYTSRILFSYVTNKVTRYLLNVANKGSYAGFSNGITAIEGMDPYALISYKWGGLDAQTGDPMGYIGDVLSKDYTKLISTTSFADLAVTGTTRPPYYGNIIHTLSWKRFELSANVSYRFGYYFRRNSLGYANLFNQWIGNSEFSERWQQPGDELITSVPSMTYPAVTNRDKFYNLSEATIEKGDVVKLQDVNLAFNASRLPIHNHGIKSLRLFVNASNVTILWRANKKGIDPDFGIGQPPAPVISFGITAGIN